MTYSVLPSRTLLVDARDSLLFLLLLLLADGWSNGFARLMPVTTTTTAAAFESLAAAAAATGRVTRPPIDRSTPAAAGTAKGLVLDAGIGRELEEPLADMPGICEGRLGRERGGRQDQEGGLSRLDDRGERDGGGDLHLRPGGISRGEWLERMRRQPAPPPPAQPSPTQQQQQHPGEHTGRLLSQLYQIALTSTGNSSSPRLHPSSARHVGPACANDVRRPRPPARRPPPARARRLQVPPPDPRPGQGDPARARRQGHPRQGEDREWQDGRLLHPRRPEGAQRQECASPPSLRRNPDQSFAPPAVHTH